MTHRERYVQTLLGQKVDRVPFLLEWSPWDSTWRRWQKEGMPEEFKGYQDVRRHFGADAMHETILVNCGPCPAIERTVLEENDQYVKFVDSWGIIRRDYKGGMSMSEFVKFPVHSHQEWEAFRDQYLNPDDPHRLDGDWEQRARRAMAAGTPLQLGCYPDVGTFGIVRWLLGDEDGLLAFYTDPTLIHEIVDHMCSLYLNVFEKVVAAGITVDIIHMWEDFCGKQGPLISPQHVDEFMAPAYRRIKAFARQHDVAILSVDTDGQPDRIVPVLMAAGMNVMWPWEVQAGCDVNEVGRKYPTLGLMGGIDKRALAKNAKAIDAELDRIMPAVERGHYIPDLDHLIPDDVSWENFSHYAKRLGRLLGAT